MNSHKFYKLIASLAAPFVAGGIGGIVTASNISVWYADLDKPFFNPPNWIFGPVWTVLYILMGVALYLAWTARGRKQQRQMALTLFGAQLALNALWSIVFFGAHLLWGAVIVILALWILIALTMYAFRPLSRAAMWLLAPYLAWVSFATILNTAVALLN